MILTPAMAPQASVTVSSDADYLRYSDPVVDDFQYKQSQILSVDNANYSQYEEQTYQQNQTQYSQAGQVLHPMRSAGQVRYQHQMQESYQQVMCYIQLFTNMY